MLGADSSLVSEDSALMYILIGGMGAVTGVLAGLAGYFIDVTVLNLHTSVWLFLIAWAATTAYLSYKRVPSGVLATGLYFVGLLVLVGPFARYAPVLAAASDMVGMHRSVLLQSGWQGIFLWGGVAGVLAMAIAILRYFLARQAQRARRRRRHTQVWHGNDND